MSRPRTQAPPRRRRHVRRSFDDAVRHEWRRYAGEPSRVLRRVLRERFLQLHLKGRRRIVLELGPGPGRFTPILRHAASERLVALDLSRTGLNAARRRARNRRSAGAVDWVQGAGEHLPLRSGSVDALVAFGNIVCFAARDGPTLLKELARVTKPNGLLLADFASPAGATQEFLYVAAQRRFLRRILRQPKNYFIDQVLETGYQPLAPQRMARWEFQFYTAAEARGALRKAGFDTFDTMSIAPNAAFQNAVAAHARREKRAWENLLRVEEQVGRREGVMETGHGFVVAAVRK